MTEVYREVMEQCGPPRAAQTAHKDILQMLRAARPPTQPLQPSRNFQPCAGADKRAAARQPPSASSSPSPRCFCTVRTGCARGCGCGRRHDLHSARPPPQAIQSPARGLGRDLGPAGSWLAPGAWASRRPSSLLRVPWGARSEALHEAAREKARAAIPLQGPFVPAVLTLLVHKDNVTFLQLDLRLALGRVRHHHAVPGGGGDRQHGGQVGRWPRVCRPDASLPFLLLVQTVLIWGHCSHLKNISTYVLFEFLQNFFFMFIKNFKIIIFFPWCLFRS